MSRVWPFPAAPVHRQDPLDAEKDRVINSADETAPKDPEAPCPHCDGTGDVHRADGEWLGSCDCGARS